MARFTIPRDVYFGEGVLDKLKELKGKRAIIVIGGGSVKRNGTLDKIEGYLKEAKIETKLIEGIESDPSVESVKNGVKVMEEFKPDWIVGVGGGSPIDAAKAMWIFYEHPNLTFEEVSKPFSLPQLRSKAKFVGITTTSGTGTEVTSFSVITDNKTGIKYPIADFNITPDIAIVDTNLAKTMTPKLVSYTGMDALTHAFEAYVSKAKTPITDALAIKSIEMMKDYLLKSFKGDKEARSEMHIAQCLAGMAFSNAILGIAHSMAHKTGKIFNIIHGCANAIYLPYVIQFNKKSVGNLYADIAKRLGLQGNAEDELVDSLIQMVIDFNNHMNIPCTLKEFGVNEKVFKDELDSIAKTSVEDPCTSTNPREISVEEMKKLFECAYYGKKVEF